MKQEYVLNDQFSSFDISRTEPSIILASATSFIAYNYETNHKKIIRSRSDDLFYYFYEYIDNNKRLFNLPNVQYYPYGDSLFTSVDTKNGLCVYDIYSNELIYRYKHDNFLTHKYTDFKRILGCVRDNGVKFYDLRCRYHINSVNQPNSFNIKFKKDDCIFSLLTNDKFFIYDYRNTNKHLSLVHCGPHDLSDFCFGSDDNFYIVKKGQNYALKSEKTYLEKNIESMFLCDWGNSKYLGYNEKRLEIIDMKNITKIEREQEKDILEIKYNGRINNFWQIDKKGLVKFDIVV